MPIIILFLYIAIIPIVLSFCKAAGMDERFRDGMECLESSYEKNN